MMESKIKKIKIERARKQRKTTIILGVIIAVIIAIDQISKMIFGTIAVTNNIENNERIMNILTHIIILSVVFKFMVMQNEFIDIKLRIILSFIFAGGFSNLIDSIFRGAVIGFINISQMTKLNIADIFVFIGWISFAAVFAAFTVKEWKKRRSKIDKNNSK